MPTQAQMTFYEENGYLIIKGLYNKQIIEKIKNISAELAQETKQFSTKSTEDKFVDLQGSVAVLTRNSKEEHVIKRIACWANSKNEYHECLDDLENMHHRLV